VRKITEIVIRGNHLKIKQNCPSCPEEGHTVVPPEGLTGDELEKTLTERYPGSKITKK